MTYPQHIAIIADGNRRWAKRQGLTEFTGHKLAVETTVENLVDYCIKKKIPYLTVWFFSTENWKRGKTWIKNFFNLFRKLLPQATNNYLKKGKDIITSAIIGLLFIIFSIFILRLIGVDILQIKGFQ